MKIVAFVTTTATNAAKGQDVLKNAGIKSEIRKIQGGTANGCLFGITVDEPAYYDAKNLLLLSNIRIISEKVFSS